MASNIYTAEFATRIEMNSAITQTASNINLSVDQKLLNYSTTSEMNAAIDIKANQITSTVSSTYSTKTETTAAKNAAIAQANSDTDDKLEDYSTTVEMNSAITQKANEITSTVSATYATKTTTNSLSSRISQTAKSIALSVNNGSTTSGITITTTKEDGTTQTATGTIQMNGLVSFTNLSTSGQTQINGSNITTGIIKSSNYASGGNGTSINLSTGVIDSKNFKVSSSGNVTATGGTIGGFTIESSKLYKDKSTLTSNTAGIYIGTDGISLGTGSIFKVTSAGALNATNATISGNITATSGTIGGWTIDSNSLTKSTGNYSFEIRTDRGTSEPSLLVWDKTNSRYNWYVRPDGRMYARNAEISGAITSSTISGSAITGGTISGATITGGSLSTSASVNSYTIGCTMLDISGGVDTAITVKGYTGATTNSTIIIAGVPYKFVCGILVEA